MACGIDEDRKRRGGAGGEACAGGENRAHLVATHSPCSFLRPSVPPPPATHVCTRPLVVSSLNPPVAMNLLALVSLSLGYLNV